MFIFITGGITEALKILVDVTVIVQNIESILKAQLCDVLIFFIVVGIVGAGLV